MGRSRFTVGFLVMTLAAGACADAGPGDEAPASPLAPAFARAAADDASEWERLLTEANARLEAEGAAYRIAYVEWLAAPGSEEQGRRVFFRDLGNRQLNADFVPGDRRRAWSGAAEITYLVDRSDIVAPAAGGGALSADQTEAALDAAMDTWDAQTCSELAIRKVEDDGGDPDFIDFVLGFGPPPAGFEADIVHAGWTPVFAPPTLGVTFTLLWVDGSGAFTDVDGNGKLDVAFREIYYSSNFPWAVDGANHIDVETVALHEVGHGLSQAHFGTAFRTDANGMIHFSPLAVMNASYSGVRRAPLGTDVAGHCSIWGNWPNG